MTIAHVSTVLAEGTINTAGWADGTYEFDISGGFANTIDLGGAGPVYDVTPASIAYGNAKYAVVVDGPIRPEIVGNWKSLKNHGTVLAPHYLGIPVYQVGKPAGEAGLGDFRGMETRVNGITQLECTFSEPIQPVLTSDVCMNGCVTGPYYPTSATLDGTGTILTTTWSGIPNGQIVGGPDAYVVTLNDVTEIGRAHV